jgi:hypothetical protein
MITGFICVPVFKFVIPEIYRVGVYFEQLGELTPSFFLALFMGIIVSKMIKPTANEL